MGRRLTNRLFVVGCVINDYGRQKSKFFFLKECQALSHY